MLRPLGRIRQPSIRGTRSVIRHIRPSVRKRNLRSSHEFNRLRSRHGPQISVRQVGELVFHGLEDILHQGESGIGTVGNFRFEAPGKRTMREREREWWLLEIDHDALWNLDQ